VNAAGRVGNLREQVVVEELYPDAATVQGEEKQREEI
jgi:hypothetical protein